MTKRIIPKPGVLVRDPVTKQPIPTEGIDVSEDDRYWLRRERDGDVRAQEQAADQGETKGAAADKSEAADKSKPQDVERI